MSEPPPSAPSDPPADTLVIKRHPSFYWEDGSLTLRTQCGTLYNVYRTPLAMKSGFFSGLFGLPYAFNEGQERPPVGADFKTLKEYAKKKNLDGHSDAKALVLPSLVDSDDLDHLFNFIFNYKWSKDTPSLLNLVGILKLSHFMEVDTGTDYAVHHLSSHPHLTAPLRLHLAISYDISDNDEQLIGRWTYKLLVRTHTKIDDHRHALAFVPPTTLHAPYCIDTASCTKAFEDAWFGRAGGSGMVSALLDAKVPGEALHSVMMQFQVYGMLEDCRVRTLSSIQDTPERKSGFKKEGVFVADALKELKVHFSLR
ncbi:hypothetical protein B0H17DRAFT_1204659 [Mycena rosella]|uniref:BTB domain-containing protein n=1 Tax=Mycena rosella TaxID=1033263 RepID=A0AAD7DA81_MYCRO|nr:hypothetical protein B0H17DRAFT_1204659 [Mycena rosella]